MMFAGNEKSKLYVKLVLRILVAGYIGFLGGQLIYKRPPDSSPWFMVAAVFFIVVAVAFIIFSIIMFFKEKAALAENTDENGSDGMRVTTTIDDSSDSGDESIKESISADTNRPSGSVSIRDMARYKSSDVNWEESDAGSDNDGSVD